MSTTPTLVSPAVGGHDHGHDHAHDHHHGHAPGHPHPHIAVPPSLLRASLAQRLAIALPVAAVLWALALWVINGGAA